MYCSSCGIDSVEGLKYCKRCGANLAAPAEGDAPRGLFGAITTGLVLLVIGGIAAFGLIAPLFMVRDLVHAGFSPKQVLLLFFCSSVATVAIIALLLPVLMRLIATSQQTGGASGRGKPAVKSSGPPQVLPQPQSIGSVTEHTTRSFEPSRFESTQT